jgi:hypothetical protein
MADVFTYIWAVELNLKGKFRLRKTKIKFELLIISIGKIAVF